MKKVILSMLILVLSLSLFMGVIEVSAETTTPPAVNKDNLYLINNNVTFEDPNDTTVSGIILPNGYWVEKISVSGSKTKVKYNGVELYIESSDLQNMSKYPYLTLKDDINYKKTIHAAIDPNNDIFKRTIYKTSKCIPAEGTVAEVNDKPELILLNAINVDTELVYIVAMNDGKIGYIKAKFTDNKTITIPDWVAPDDPEPETKPNENVTPDTGTGGDEPGSGDTTTPKPPKEDSDLQPTQGKVVKIVLIVAICVLAGVLVFLVFKPVRKKKSGKYTVDDDDDTDDYYDERDDYNDRY